MGHRVYYCLRILYLVTRNDLTRMAEHIFIHFKRIIGSKSIGIIIYTIFMDPLKLCLDSYQIQFKIHMG